MKTGQRLRRLGLQFRKPQAFQLGRLLVSQCSLPRFDHDLLFCQSGLTTLELRVWARLSDRVAAQGRIAAVHGSDGPF